MKGDRVTKNKNKHLLVKNEVIKLKALALSYFWGKNYFEGNDGAQNASVFQTMQKHFDLRNVDDVSKWKSNRLSNQYLDAVGTLGDVVLSKPIKPMHVIFKRKGTLVQNDIDIIAVGPVINIYIVYKTSSKTINSNFVFKNCLFGAIKIKTLQILILVNGNIPVMVLDLIQKENLHVQMKEMVKMLLFLELI